MIRFRCEDFFKKKQFVPSFHLLGGKAKILGFVVMSLPTFLVVIFNLAFFSRYFPLSEGWWEVYGHMINRGLIPYRDFYLAFPPLVPYCYAGLERLFGINFLLFRGLGIVLVAVNTILIQRLLGIFFRPVSAALGTMLAMFLAMGTNVVYVANDYHSFVDFFIASSLLVLVCAIIQPNRGFKFVVQTFFLGFLTAGLFLCKQNIGFFLGFSYLTVLWLCAPSPKALILTTSCFVLGVFSAMVPFLYYFQSHEALGLAATSIFSGNDAKGSPFIVLTRIFSNLGITSRLIAAILLSVFMATILRLRTLVDFSKWIRRSHVRMRISMFFFALAMVFLLCAGFFFGSLLNDLIMVFSMACLIRLLTRLLNKRYSHAAGLKLSQKWRLRCAFAVPLTASVYCCSQTAGFNFTGLLFVVAFAATQSLQLLRNLKVPRLCILLTIFVVLILPVTHKFKEPYNWWGLSEGSVIDATQTLSSNELKGMRVSPLTRQTFDATLAAIHKYSFSDNDVFIFPQIPIFYLLANKKCPTRSIVQWFDVISSKEALADLHRIQTIPPQIIVFLDYPDFVAIGHKKLIRHALPQEKFREYFQEIEKTGQYHVVERILFNQNLSSAENAGDLSTGTYRVFFKADMGLNDFRNLTADCSFSQLSFQRNGFPINFTEGVSAFRRGDRLEMRLKKKCALKVIDRCGEDADDSSYQLKILVRTDSGNFNARH